MTPQIRRAQVTDAPAAARCHIACWAEAYEGIAGPEALAARIRDLQERVERWRRFAESGPPRWLAVDQDDTVVGFAAAGPGRDQDIDPGLELYAIYARSSHYGTGLGARLLTAAIAESAAHLWVFEANFRARAFYARHGFACDGSRKWTDAFGAWEVRMRRPER